MTKSTLPPRAAPLDLQAIDAGFSAKAAEYDDLAGWHPVVIWMRERIRGVVEANCPAGGRILEINAGSGLDAAYLASKGYRVHAIDVATGMLSALAAKASSPDLDGRLTYETLSFTDLDRVGNRPYDLIFSNLGGLNCIDDLGRVTRHLSAVLQPGGVVVWVIMPPVSPWEIAQALRGHWRTAFRRLQRGGTAAKVGGKRVPVWYHSATTLKKALGPAFQLCSLRSFCLFAPPAFFSGFVRRHPGLTRRLMWLDDLLGARWPFRRAGDFYVIVARFQPELEGASAGADRTGRRLQG